MAQTTRYQPTTVTVRVRDRAPTTRVAARCWAFVLNTAIVVSLIASCSAGTIAPPPRPLAAGIGGGSSAVTPAPAVPVAAAPAQPVGAGAGAPGPAALSPAVPIATPNVAVGGSGGAGGTSSTQAPHPMHAGDTGDHCLQGFSPDVRDAQLTGLPDTWQSPQGEVDLVVPKPVLDWMTEHVWQKAHEDWHALRNCRGPARPDSICALAPELIAKDQVCTNASDGLQFLAMHRHMLEGLRQAFPQHRDLFAPFARFPTQAADVPEQWRARFEADGGFAPDVARVGALLQDIETNAALFTSEGDLGRYIQCGASDMSGKPGGPRAGMPLHVALHNQFIVSASPHSVGNGRVNIENFMFWKLHGWIDEVWQRYRRARGLSDDEPAHKQAVAAQCREMDALSRIRRDDTATVPMAPLPEEHGVFHERVRPIFEKTCRGCHDATSPEAGLALAGNVSSAEIVSQLVNNPSRNGGQFLLVVPGDPQRSWLYLKPAGLAAGAGCTGAFCNTQVMPPAGRVTLPQLEIDALRQWIMDGAPAPGAP